jgi:hypothetical protein
MNKKLRFLRYCGALGLAAAALAGACKALSDNGIDPDYLMPLPDGVILQYDTGNGSYVPYEAGLSPGDKIAKPSDPSWPNTDAVFGGWFRDNITFNTPWDFTNDTIPPDAGKYMSLYTQWNPTTTERWVARNYVWENQGAHIMGQIAELEPAQSYTLTVKCWMQGGSPSQVNHIVAFCLDPDTGTRTYSVRQQVSPNDLWTELSYTFEAKNRWYVVGVFPGLAASGGGTFYLREMKLTKTGDTANMLGHPDFKFGIGLDEEKTYYTQGSLSTALTTAGKSGSFLPRIWYNATSQIFSIVREQYFWTIEEVTDKIEVQGGTVYLDDR